METRPRRTGKSATSARRIAVAALLIATPSFAGACAPGPGAASAREGLRAADAGGDAGGAGDLTLSRLELSGAGDRLVLVLTACSTFSGPRTALVRVWIDGPAAPTCATRGEAVAFPLPLPAAGCVTVAADARGVPAATYRASALVDADCAVAERDEGNNVAGDTGRVPGLRVNLALTRLTATPAPDGSVALALRLCNDDARARTTDLHLWLDGPAAPTCATPGPDAAVTVTLDAATCADLGGSVSLPLGAHRLSALLDGRCALAEVDEADNARAVTFTAACGAGRCTIAGRCVAAGTSDGADRCRVCLPAERRDGWSLGHGCTATYFGGPTRGFRDGPAATALMDGPNAVTFDKLGGLYISDTGNDAIRKLYRGVLTTVAGSGREGYKDGPARSAEFGHTTGIALDGSGPDGAGKVYINDMGTHTVRLLTGGVVSTYAGTNRPGYRDGPRASALFNEPLKVVFGPARRRLYVADFGNRRVRVIDTATGLVSTLAGSGIKGKVDGPAASARFGEIRGIGVDAAGRVYVVENDNAVIRVIEAGRVRTFAGAGTPGHLDGPLATARFRHPWDIAFDASGAAYVPEIGNVVLRRIAGGVVDTVAGTPGAQGFAEGPLGSARFDTPFRVTVGPRGLVYVGDRDNNRVRVIRP